MTGLHDNDGMKSGKALVTEYNAVASVTCIVSFLEESLEIPESILIFFLAKTQCKKVCFISGKLLLTREKYFC